MTASAAAAHTGVPPNVVPWGPGVNSFAALPWATTGVARTSLAVATAPWKTSARPEVTWVLLVASCRYWDQSPVWAWAGASPVPTRAARASALVDRHRGLSVS